MNINELVREFLDESSDDYVALWEIVKVSREDLKAKEDVQARALSLEIVGKLYDEGLRPGDYWGGGFDSWPDEGRQAVIDRIEREWIEIGHDPNPLNPICWFAARGG